MKKAFTALISAALVLSLTACGGNDADSTQDTASNGTAVEVQTVQRQEISAESTVSGTVSAGNEVALYTALQAEVETVPVEVGDLVSAGDIICTLDVDTYKDNLATLQSNYATASSSYNSQKILFDEQIRQLENNLSNTQALFAIGAASQLEVDTANLNLLNARTTADSTLRSLSDSMQQIQDNIRPLQETIEKATIRSTIDGTVTAVNVEEGAFASSAYAVATVSENGNRQVAVSVSETLMPKLKVGDTVAVQVESVAAQLNGTISKISPSANPQTKIYDVTIDLPAGTDVNAGMFASVIFYTETNNDAVVIPTEAILTDGTVQYVFTVDGDVAHYTEIETSLIGDGITEVTHGLSGGETLVTSGQSYLSEGAAVRIVEA